MGQLKNKVAFLCEALELRQLLTSVNFNFNPPAGTAENVEVDFDTPIAPTGVSLTLTNLASNATFSSIQTIGTWSGGAAIFFTFPTAAHGLPDGDYYADVTDGSGTLGTQDFYAYGGDTNHDRLINISDFNAVAANYGQTNATNSEGDSNYDGVVNLLDLNSIATNFGKTLAWTPRFTVSDISDDPTSIFDEGTPATATFSRTSVSDMSQDENIYYSFDPKTALGEARPNIDYDPGDLAPGSSNVYVLTIPAGDSSAVLEYDPLDDEFRGNNESVFTICRGNNDGGIAVPMGGPGISTVNTKILVKRQHGDDIQLNDTSAEGLKRELETDMLSGNLITELRISGHASENSIDLGGNDLLTTSTGGQQILTQSGEDIAPLLKGALAPNATVRLQGCKTGNNPGKGGANGTDDGKSSLAAEMSKGLPGINVIGYRGLVKDIVFTNTVIGHTRTFKDGNLIDGD
jgi:hypothetical protein